MLIAWLSKKNRDIQWDIKVVPALDRNDGFAGRSGERSGAWRIPGRRERGRIMRADFGNDADLYSAPR
jgi:hypothetical protein